jgi:23S rRNA-/tRNA-specific pseudouridylate synthase
VTNYKVMKQQQLSDILWRNFILMKLVTGRKHQIRCQLSQHLINPIINDELYLGRKVAALPNAIYLHAFALKISSKALIEQVFKLPLNEPGTVLDNEKGSIHNISGNLQIFAKLPPHWQ